MAKLTRIALDLCLLIDLADANRAAWANLRAFTKAVSGNIIVTQVVSQALAEAAIEPSYDNEMRRLAISALQRLDKKDWDIRLHRLPSHELGVCERNVQVYMDKKLLPPSSTHVAHTIAEAAAHNCGYLLTHDPELLELDSILLNKLLDDSGRDSMWIGTPANALKLQQNS